MSTGLVLAGGGVAGIAWELGVLLGIVDERPDLAGPLLAADVLVGTSAGSTVAAQLTSGTAFGANPLSPTTRAPSARAGREVGRRHADAVANLLGRR